VFSSGVFELKIHSFHTAQRICRRHRDCHIFFRICLKHPEDVISAEPPCTFGTGHTNVIRADHTSISSSAPIKVPFHFKWPTTKTTWSVVWRPRGDWPSARTGPRMCILASKASCGIPTTSSATSFTSGTGARTTADQGTTRWVTTPVTRRATASVWRAGRGTTAPSVRNMNSPTLQFKIAPIPRKR
ncbi:unnamed protein product, partial [Tetraodon nigroviridis]